MAVIAINDSPYVPVRPAQVHVPQDSARAVSFDDAAALSICVHDAAHAEQWLDQKQWALGWRETDVLYQSPRQLVGFENSTAMRANIPRFTVARHVNALVPTLVSGIFYDPVPFLLRPRPAMTQAAARAKTKLISVLLAEISFKLECERAMESMVAKGTCICKAGCYTTRKIRKRVKRARPPLRVATPFGGERAVPSQESDEFEVEEREETRWQVFFEMCPLGTVLVDPKWRHANQLQRAKWLVDRKYLNYYELRELLSRDEYARLRPSDKVLQSWFATPAETAVAPGSIEQQQKNSTVVHHAETREVHSSEDPLLRPLKVDERWDADTVMCVIQDKYLVRNDEHHFGRHPFFSANWWNIEGAGYGLGIGRLTGADQRLEAGATNAAVDILAFTTNPQYVRARSANALTQQIRAKLAGIIDVDVMPGQKASDVFDLLKQPSVPREVWEVIQAAKQASDAVGADDAFVQGNIPDKGANVFRTAGGAARVGSASDKKIEGPMGRFVDGVYLPFLGMLDEMINERMPITQVREILADELGEDEELDLDSLLQTAARFEVLAGAHLAARKAMAQSLPWMIQVFTNPHITESLNATGWMADIKELFAMIAEVSEWRNQKTLIRKMTDEERQKYEHMMSPQAAKVQGDIQKIQAQGAVDTQLSDQKNEARLASNLMESAFDRAGAYEERQEVRQTLEQGI